MSAETNFSPERCILKLVDPIHVRSADQKRNCHFCGVPLWGQPSKPKEPVFLACPPCFQSKVAASEASYVSNLRCELYDSCAAILTGEPSQLKLPAWPDILCRPDMYSIPGACNALDENLPLLVHAVARARRADVLRLVLQRYPRSLEANDKVVLFNLCVFTSAVL